MIPTYHDEVGHDQNKNESRGQGRNSAVAEDQKMTLHKAIERIKDSHRLRERHKIYGRE